MTLAKRLSDLFTQSERLIELRYMAAKTFFLLCTFLFFLNYFFVGARFYYDIHIALLPFTYVLFVCSLFLYSFFAIQKKLQGKLPGVVFIALFIILGIFFSIFALSFLFDISSLLGYSV